MTTANPMCRTRTTGFTLIELMITVAIVAILTAIAYPSYLEHLRKAGRAEGKSGLLRTAQLLERYYTANGGYPANPGDAYGGTLAGAATVYSGENAAATTGKYTITIAVSTPNPPPSAGSPQTYNTYILTATPQGSFQDPVCGNLTLTSTGVRGYSNVAATPQQCW